MKWKVPFDATAERLVVIGRIVLSVIALAFLDLEPVGAFPNQQALLALAWIWFGYAVLAALAAFRAEVMFPVYRMATHVIDTGLAVAMIWLSTDAGTPFRIIGTFAILSAGLRLGWRSIAATTAIILGALGAVAVRTGTLLHDPAFRMTHFAMGVAIIAMLAIMLAHLQRRDGRLRADLERLASWTRAPIAEAREVLRETLERTAAVLEAPSAMLVWEETEEPWLHIASWSGGEFRWLREPPHRYAPLVASPLEGRSFFTRNVCTRMPLIFYRDGNAMRMTRAAALHPEFAPLVPGAALLSVCIEAESIEGRLFVSGIEPPGPDDLLTAEVVADLVGARLDQWRAIEGSQEMAVREERIRLARDLHDGLLQSLTGVALHLQTAQRQIATQPEEAIRSLEDLQDVIASDQRELRGFIQQLRPFGGSVTATARLTGRLEDLGSRFKNQFGLNVRMNTESLSPLVSDEMRFEIFALVNEGLANVAKHAEATSVDVNLTSDASEIRIVIADDGKGFPFRGTWDLEALSRMKRGPLSLKERIASLGGNLIIDSTDHGARLDIRVPR